MRPDVGLPDKDARALPTDRPLVKISNNFRTFLTAEFPDAKKRRRNAGRAQDKVYNLRRHCRIIADILLAPLPPPSVCPCQISVQRPLGRVRLSHKKWGGFRLYDILTDLSTKSLRRGSGRQPDGLGESRLALPPIMKREECEN